MTGDGAENQTDPDDRLGKRVDAAAGLFGSPHYLWERTKANGLPRWALWIIGVAFIVGVAGAIGVYAATRSLLAAGVIPGVCWVVGGVVLNMADLDRRARE